MNTFTTAVDSTCFDSLFYYSIYSVLDRKHLVSGLKGDWKKQLYCLKRQTSDIRRVTHHPQLTTTRHNVELSSHQTPPGLEPKHLIHQGGASVLCKLQSQQSLAALATTVEGSRLVTHYWDQMKAVLHWSRSTTALQSQLVDSSVISWLLC